MRASETSEAIGKTGLNEGDRGRRVNMEEMEADVLGRSG
jgi:predicted transcriptional regulator